MPIHRITMGGFRKVLALLAILLFSTARSLLTLEDRFDALETRILVDSWRTTQELKRLDKLIQQMQPAELNPQVNEGDLQYRNTRMDSLEMTVDSFTKHVQETVEALANGLAREKLLQRKMTESMRSELLNHTNVMKALETKANAFEQMDIYGILKPTIDNKTLEKLKPYVLEILRDIGPNLFAKQRLPNECPKDWLRIKDTCYLYVEKSLSWESANQACTERGARLAEPNDAQTLDTMINMGPDKFWIGGTDVLTEGTWMWTGSNKELTYFDWGDGQPNSYGGEQDCLMIWKEQFNDEDCVFIHNFVCEKYIGIV